MYAMQLLPDEQEIRALKSALRKFVAEEPEHSLANTAWGILAKIEDKERDNRAKS